MKITCWEKHGNVYVGIDDADWKRAVIFPEAGRYFGYVPLGYKACDVRQLVDTNLRRLKRTIAEAVREI